MPYILRLKVAASDLDELKHVNNLVYLRWVQDAAVAHSAAVGLGMDWYLERGEIFVVRRHEIDYLRAAVEGDEVEVLTQVSETGPATAVRRTGIRRARDGEVLARAVTLWAYANLSTGRPVRIPDEVRNRFEIEPVPEAFAGRRKR